MDTVVHQSSESHLTISDHIAKAVHVHSLNLEHYRYDKIHARVDPIWDLNGSLRDTDEAYCRALDESFRNQD